MTNKIDETPDSGSEKIVVPQHELLSDSGTRREDGWYMASYRYDDETVESPAKVKGDYILFFGDSFWRGALSDRVTLLYRITPPASLAAKDKEIARLKIALADAIRRPMGVIPDSAAGLISIDEMDEAEKRRTAETSSLAAMREAISFIEAVRDILDTAIHNKAAFNATELTMLRNYMNNALSALSTTPHAPNDDGLAKLKAVVDGVVDRLPKTADGVPITPPMDVFVLRDADMDTRIEPDKIILQFDSFNGYEPTSRAYSTREAAELAAKQEQR